MELFEGLVTEEQPIRNWKQFQNRISRFGDQTCFRGHADAAWSLGTSLDRAVWKTFSTKIPSIQSTSSRKMNVTENEKALLLAFQRGAHHYLARTPQHHRTIDWLALMQHHATPTRLLDWSRSPYVALYFAI